MNQQDGGPAFPVPGEPNYHVGMSVRTWLAGMFAAAIFANPACKKMNVDDVALRAHAGADAMLAEGEKQA